MGPNLKFWGRVCFCFLISLFILCPPSHGLNLSIDEGVFSRSFPGPRLLYPVTDNIDLKGEAYLEFKWERSNFVDTRSYDFRLYKGYNTTQPNLILKRSVSATEYPIKVESSTFEINQVYTWVLVQVSFGGNKSDKSFSSFKIIKK